MPNDAVMVCKCVCMYVCTCSTLEYNTNIGYECNFTTDVENDNHIILSQ